MATRQQDRVLSRKGARWLEEGEFILVSGSGQVTTTYCSVLNPVTGKPDGDCD